MIASASPADRNRKHYNGLLARIMYTNAEDRRGHEKQLGPLGLKAWLKLESLPPGP